MESPAVLRDLDEERELVERDLAVGEWERARRRAGLALERLDDYVRSVEPEVGEWMRVLRILAGTPVAAGVEAQLSLWPHLQDSAESLTVGRKPNRDGPHSAGPQGGDTEGAGPQGGNMQGANPPPPARPLSAVLRLASSRVRVITRDRAMLGALDLLARLAPTELPVLLEGETGTGKEVIASSVHAVSPRRERPFVAVNCGAIPGELHESELFGHTRGAYTGATMEKPGLFEAAHQGTLFLDEIGEMEWRAQVKLLRVLESGELRRLGEVRTRQVDVRVIAATNHDVDEAIRQGRFRKDLLYRLGAVRVMLPPLRKRRRDILPLALHFLRQATSRIPLLTPGAEASLLAHDWPGNVRELKFVVLRAAALWRGSGQPEITREMLFPSPLTADERLPGDVAARGRRLDAAPTEPGDADAEQVEQGGGSQEAIEPRAERGGPPRLPEQLPEGLTYEAFLESIERRLIERALERAGENRTLAARALGGMSRTTLIGKMKRLGLFRAQAE